MSYTKSIKNELAQVVEVGRCCNIAEIAGLINTAGAINADGFLLFKCENWAIAKKYFTLLKKTFNIDVIHHQKMPMDKSSAYELAVNSTGDTSKVLAAAGVSKDNAPLGHVSAIVMKNACCKRAYIRGTFLVGGSVASPEKGYHLEIAQKTTDAAASLLELLLHFDIDARIIKRRTNVALYVKDSAKIADFINVCGAKNALFDYENTKALKEVRNGVNRLVNCDTSNIKKAVNTAQKQINAINLIDKKAGLSSLPAGLKAAAIARYENPDLKLSDIGDMLGLSKSGINHRLKKIEAIAETYNTED